MNEENNRNLVTVSYRLPFLCSDFVIDEKFCILLMSQTTFGHLFCIGDQIIYINGKSPKTPKDASKMMKKRGIIITVTILRQSNIFPVSPERAKKVGLKRRKGFHYFVALIKITSNQQSLGLAVRKVGENIYVSKLLNDGCAANVLRLSDCIIDVAEKKVIDEAFLRKILVKTLLATNECTLLIERVDHGRPLSKSTSSFMAMIYRELDPTMPEDAAKIGMKQSKYFRENCRKSTVFPLTAKTILKSSTSRSVTSSSCTSITATTQTISSNKTKDGSERKSSNRIILEPNFTKEIKMEMKPMPPPPPFNNAQDRSIGKSKTPPLRHVKFSPSISSTLSIPSDYSNCILEKVVRRSHSYTVPRNNMLNKQKNKMKR